MTPSPSVAWSVERAADHGRPRAVQPEAVGVADIQRAGFNAQEGSQQVKDGGIQPRAVKRFELLAVWRRAS